MGPLWPLLSAVLILSIVVSAALAGLALLIDRKRRSLDRELAQARERNSAMQGDLKAAAAKLERVAALEAELAGERDRANSAEQGLAGATASLAAREQSLAELRNEMEGRFAALAQTVLSKQTETLTAVSQERLEGLLGPLRGQIDKFEKAFVDDGKARADQTATLRSQIAMLGLGAEKVQLEAGNLAKALKGQVQVQGAWGEMVLHTILEKSGLRRGEEFFIHDTRHADGRRLQPDVVVNLPGGEKLIVDSKVSLTSFEKCVGCEDDAERGVHLRGHASSLRNHIKGLADKDYSANYQGVDFVIMFVPIEGALSLALQNDPEIASYALTRNIFIASPTTLLLALRTVENLWRVERQNRNAEEIAKTAGKLYGSFVKFLGEIKTVGAALGKAHDEYEKAYKRLGTGRDNLVRLSERLRDMGARTNDAIPDDVLAISESAGEEEAGAQDDADGKVLAFPGDARGPDPQA